MVVESSGGKKTVMVDFAASGFHFLGSYRHDEVHMAMCATHVLITCQGSSLNVTLTAASSLTKTVDVDVLWITGHEIIDSEDTER